MIGAYARSLARLSSEELARHGALFSAQLHALVGAAISADEPVREGLERDSLAAARRAWIDRWLDLHYASPGVTAEQAARAAGISVRYLHRLFEMTSQTFSRALLERRLAAARAALDNPFDQRTITAIAHDCGFLDTAHFARCFRAAFGLTPSEYRHGR